MRELLPTDAEGMFRLDGDPEVHRYLGKNPVTSIEQCRKVIDFIREQYTGNGIGRWAVVERSTGEFVGWSGLKLMKEKINGHVDFYDIGYRLIKAHWGKGYATESAAAARRYAFEVLKATDLFAMADVNNRASRRVLEKTGLQYIKTFPYDGPPGWLDAGEPVTWYHMANPSL